MTSKRKTILTALSKSPLSTLDDLELATGIARKNLADNLKACLKPVELIERVRDDVTHQPGYRLTTKGRMWLTIDKSARPTESPTILSTTPARASDHLPEVAAPDEGAAVVEPPPPDDSPVAVGSDVISNEEQMALALAIAGLENDLARKTAMVEALQCSLAAAQEIIDGQTAGNKCLAAEIRELKALPVADSVEIAVDNRYLVADSYIIIFGRQEAQRAALQIALDSGSTAVIASIFAAEQVSINPIWESA